MAHRLDQQVAIITGASRGIGRAIAEAYAAEGASLCLIATDESRLNEVKDALGLPPERIMTTGLNVTDRDACFAAVAQVEHRFGRVDVLVNNAGVYRAKPFMDYVPQDFQDMLDVNLFGVLHFTQACLPGMQAREHGRIINMASTAGKWGSRNQSAYNVSKHAVVGLTRCLALEASPYKVTVNAICPGFIQTDMVEELKAQVALSSGISGDDMVKAVLTRVPLGRVLEPCEIASLAVYLGSAESRGMTGQSIHLDGGMVLS
ncbi:SDR family NAD(P)-dependent oxidoreductase [Limnohabitans planktonicus]|uniref:SDR family oxidoreductase n=1 Tax=Limnohabitans planktonicus II-D5 TaxID=1293045 RepID=A0A2T7UBG0_9BURK|nr:SDR family NAD(P)-dependent oxidoreductase [Limnohabitans planktonicus]PVE42003.1 SDR family oxidoreductase [Limnohabitans planktonicus II-D5]